jgi:hypothetical protein
MNCKLQARNILFELFIFNLHVPNPEASYMYPFIMANEQTTYENTRTQASKF